MRERPGSGAVPIPEQVRDAIHRRVAADLQPSPATIHTKIAAAVVGGGLLSLFFCGQFGFGLSSIAQEVHDWLTSRAGLLGCTTLCGGIFAAVPVLILRGLCPPLQFRSIVRRHWSPLVVWTGVFGMGMILRDGIGSEPLYQLLVWTAAGVLTFKALATVVDQANGLWHRRVLGSQLS